MSNLKIDQAKKLMENEQFNEAFLILETLDREKVLPCNDLLSCQILKGTLLNKLGRYEESLKLAEQLLQESKKRNLSLQRIKALIIATEALQHLGRLDEGFKTIEQAENFFQTLNLDPSAELTQTKASTLYLKSVIYWRKGIHDQALKYQHESLILRQELGDKRAMAESFHMLGNIYLEKDNLDQALGEFLQAQTLFEEVGGTKSIGRVFNGIGSIHWQQGNLDQALDYFERYQTIGKELNDNQAIGYSLHNMGLIYIQRGKLNKALWHFEQSLVLLKALNQKIAIATCLNNIGLVYKEKGDLNRALKEFQQSLTLREELGNKTNIAKCLDNIGVVHHIKGELPQALEAMEQSLTLAEEDEASGFIISENLVHLVAVAIDMNDLALAQQYLECIQKIKDANESKTIDQRYRFSKAIFLKADHKTSEKLRFSSLHAVLTKQVTAQQLLRQIVEEDVVEHVLTVEAIFNLCEMLLLELKTLGNEAILEEVKLLVQKLREIGEEEDSLSLLAKNYWLMAKLALLEPDVEQARELLARARQIADVNGYDQLTSVITREEKQISGELPSWLFEENLSLLERLNQTQFESLIISLRQNRVDYFTEVKTPSMDDLKSFTDQLSKRKLEW
ncbi:MAG: tetratricopeptide repeat protein [Promethearchaeota archaeon]